MVRTPGDAGPGSIGRGSGEWGVGSGEKILLLSSLPTPHSSLPSRLPPYNSPVPRTRPDPERQPPVSTADRISEYLAQFSQTRTQMIEQLRRVVIGQTDVIEQILAAIFTRGHCLLVGVPGLAKTLMVSSIAQILDISFKRIQFTPDLMPSDITGTTVLDESSGRREFRYVTGPVFANIILADEINRTPPKTPAALLDALQAR